MSPCATTAPDLSIDTASANTCVDVSSRAPTNRRQRRRRPHNAPVHEEELTKNHDAQVMLTSQLNEQAAQIARLTREIDALRSGATTKPLTKPRAAVAVTTTAQQERRLSESATCCRWTNSEACGSDVTYKCTRLHEYLESKASTHVFEDADSCLGSTQADWSFAFHGEDAEVALSTAGSEVARVKTPIKVTHAADCSATAELQLDTTALGALSVTGTLTSSDGTDIGEAITALQQQMAAVKAADVVDHFWSIDTTAASVTADSKFQGAVAVGKFVYLAPYGEDNVGVVDTATGTFSTISTAAAGVTAAEKFNAAAAVGDFVYFTPFQADNVGVLDTTTSNFTTIDITAAGAIGTYKYAGAAAVGTSVFFGPHGQDID